MNYLTVNDFKWTRGVNDAEYIKLLLNALDRQKKITAKAIDKLKKVDAVPVVRCKDCKHYLDGGCGNVDSQSPSKKLMGVKPNWYCADGERREE